MLKLREQVSGYQSPQPIRFIDHPPVDYPSESELDIFDYRSRIPHRFRPTSSLDGRALTAATLKNARHTKYCVFFVKGVSIYKLTSVVPSRHYCFARSTTKSTTIHYDLCNMNYKCDNTKDYWFFGQTEMTVRFCNCVVCFLHRKG